VDDVGEAEPAVVVVVDGDVAVVDEERGCDVLGTADVSEGGVVSGLDGAVLLETTDVSSSSSSNGTVVELDAAVLVTVAVSSGGGEVLRLDGAVLLESVYVSSSSSPSYSSGYSPPPMLQ
jgi:hypothetical protein